MLTVKTVSGGEASSIESELIKGFFNYLEKVDARLITLMVEVLIYQYLSTEL